MVPARAARQAAQTDAMRLEHAERGVDVEDPRDLNPTCEQHRPPVRHGQTQGQCVAAQTQSGSGMAHGRPSDVASLAAAETSEQAQHTEQSIAARQAYFFTGITTSCDKWY